MNKIIIPERFWSELAACSSQHNIEAQSQVSTFIHKTEDRYIQEIDLFLDLFHKDSSIFEVLSPFILEVRNYLYWLRWVGWNISHLAPVLYKNHNTAVERLALASLAYVSGRLIDDGFDNHDTYKGYKKSLVGVLREQNPKALDYSLCVQSAFIGFNLFHHALNRMRECNHYECADEINRLFKVVSVGVLAECFAKRDISIQVYQQIIRRKAVAYNMILYKPFLLEVESELRTFLLKILAEMDELAQIINDYNDVQEDQSKGQLNALVHNIYNAVSIETEIYSRLSRLWESVSPLSTRIQNAFAAMFESLGIYSFKILDRSDNK